MFEQLDPDPDCGAVFNLTIDHNVVGELCALDCDRAAPIVLTDDQARVINGANAWTLDLADENGRMIGRHILWPVSPEHASSSSLSGELAAWATLTVTWASLGRARQQG
jgi:hypothetical protein